MIRFDLEDLPPKAAARLRDLAEGETLLLVEHGLVVGALTATSTPDQDASPPPPDPDASMEEVLDHFKSIIDEAF